MPTQVRTVCLEFFAEDISLAVPAVVETDLVVVIDRVGVIDPASLPIVQLTETVL